MNFTVSSSALSSRLQAISRVINPKAIYPILEDFLFRIENGKLTVTSSSPNKALYKLAKSMINKEMSFVTLISGEGVSEEEAASAVEMLENKFADQVDITYIKGDQPIYYYIFSVE